MMSSKVVADACPEQAARSEARAFIDALQNEMAIGKLELPAFPNVSVQLQQLLMDEDVGNDKVVRLVSLEPVLAGRVMQLANSAALNPRGTPVVELRTAVARLGFNALRAAAISFAITQLRMAPAYRAIRTSLEALWRESVAMAATACVVARRARRMSPDTALFAGLVSAVGKICLLARACGNQALASDPGSYRELVRAWHPEVTRTLLRHWSVPEEIITAVDNCHRQIETARGAAALTDVLRVAQQLALPAPPEQLLEMLGDSPCAARLGLDADACIGLLTASSEELGKLRGALGEESKPH